VDVALLEPPPPPPQAARIETDAAIPSSGRIRFTELPS
jgi:hypothetical protein